jgi:hypothetical protein
LIVRPWDYLKVAGAILEINPEYNGTLLDPSCPRQKEGAISVLFGVMKGEAEGEKVI